MIDTVSMVHGIVTGRGRAMRIITDRLLPIIKGEQGAWVEPQVQKEVSDEVFLFRRTQHR